MRNGQTKSLPISEITAIHVFKFVIRSVMFLTAGLLYIKKHISGTDVFLGKLNGNSVILLFMWFIFMADMILRAFPSKYSSMGCQKQFKKNYIPTGNNDPQINSNKMALLVAVLWISGNLVAGFLYKLRIIDEGLLILLSLAYSIGDMVCVLFFCPFQTWFMKNKCCTSCRIYNWDYAMMFTPLVFIKNFFALSLFAVGFIFLVFWELSLYKHPERFSEKTNACLSCSNCTEKLCLHKRQLRSYLVKNKERFYLKGNSYIEKKSDSRATER